MDSLLFFYISRLAFDIARRKKLSIYSTNKFHLRNKPCAIDLAIEINTLYFILYSAPFFGLRVLH